MPKTRIGLAAAGAVISVAVAAGSLGLTATAANAINCPPPAAAVMASRSGGPGC